MSVIRVIPDSSVWCAVQSCKGRVHSLYPLRLLLDRGMSKDRMCFVQRGTGNTSMLHLGAVYVPTRVGTQLNENCH